MSSPLRAVTFSIHKNLLKEGFTRKEFWNTVQLIFTATGGRLGYFLGGCDGLPYALIVFVVVDYITGVMCAAADGRIHKNYGKCCGNNGADGWVSLDYAKRV